MSLLRGFIDASFDPQRLLRAVWLLAILIVVVGSLLPSTSFPMRVLNRLQVNDKLEHVLAYMALAFLPAIHERRPIIIAAAVGVAAPGVALEFGQLFSGWRDFEIGDMVADAVGVCVGLAVAIPMRRMQMVAGRQHDAMMRDGGRLAL